MQNTTTKTTTTTDRMRPVHLAIMETIKEGSPAHLADIHDALVARDDMPYTDSPARGDGYNDERFEIRDHVYALRDHGLAMSNLDQSWILTKDACRLLALLEWE